MQHVGLKETSQYATSLSTDIWDPTNLPRWAYKEELQKMQQEFRRKTEEEKTSTTARDTIEFVQGSHETSRTGNPGQKAPRRGNNWA